MLLDLYDALFAADAGQRPSRRTHRGDGAGQPDDRRHVILLNAAALAGSAALEQHLAVTLEDYVADLDKAHGNALSAQSLLPDVQRASVRFSRLADDERQSGALTGTSGSGSVVQLLSQMSQQLDEVGASIIASRETVATQFEQGSQHLANMRGLVSASGAVQPRADQFAAEALAFQG